MSVFTASTRRTGGGASVSDGASVRSASTSYNINPYLPRDIYQLYLFTALISSIAKHSTSVISEMAVLVGSMWHVRESSRVACVIWSVWV